MSLLGTSKKREILEKGNRIAKTFTNSGLLDIPVVFSMIGDKTNNLAVKFSLNDNAYSGASYFVEGQKLMATGIGVNSNLGNRTGTLLFHLTLLLAISCNTSVFYLDNFTDEPARAASGIYQLLDVDKTIARHATPRSEFTGLNLEDQLNLAEGGMYLKIDASTYGKWKNKMTDIASKVETEKLPSPWIQPVKTNMQRFVTQISQFEGFSGGRKIRRKRRFSQKTTKKSRKMRKKSKKKKGKRKSNF